ncbi:sulfurtransferase [Luteimonas marina]|uniref:Sulfurtransferase n=1 Tax=Luteimonas marina TaxID=488485 RepID=A0A5C5TVD5_9GAMM|nr:rhodanese-like domain-containing protein [Luteimonas marina]TWT17557.1 sulfurtransferase [Luteimonas marina]
MTGLSRRLALASAVATLLCLAVAPALQAQDSFGGSGQRQPSPPPPPRATQARPDPSMQSGQPRFAPPAASGEAQDFGVAPTPQLRPSDQLGGPTPTAIPGGRVIGTQQLAQLLQGGQGKVLLLHAYAGPEHLPGAVAVVPAAQGGSFDDQVQQGFGQYLQQATGGDKSKMLVVYCGGTHCWGSYNAALRAIEMGYGNVHWYRGGIDAWRQAGFPVRNAMDGQGGQGR